ncbi:unnamed protein product [Durusdinium trenchii]|uniref:Uncharacterized protein n=1 Tax=Durusdinium trenchii TaxID=1381693 RepID=A0ABP0QRV3_9DINO
MRETDDDRQRGFRHARGVLFLYRIAIVDPAFKGASSRRPQSRHQAWTMCPRRWKSKKLRWSTSHERIVGGSQRSSGGRPVISGDGLPVGRWDCGSISYPTRAPRARLVEMKLRPKDDRAWLEARQVLAKRTSALGGLRCKLIRNEKGAQL